MTTPPLAPLPQLPSGSHLAPAGQVKARPTPASLLPAQTPASPTTLKSPAPSPPQTPASLSVPAVQPVPAVYHTTTHVTDTAIVLGKGAAAIPAKDIIHRKATGERDNPLLSASIDDIPPGLGIIPVDITSLADLAHHPHQA